MKKIILSFLFLFIFNIFCFASDDAAINNDKIPDVASVESINSDIEIKEAVKKSILREFGFYGGYAKGSLKEKGPYHVAQMGMRFGFDMNPLLSKIHLKPPYGELDFVVEPFINPIIDPNANVELGVALVFKYILPITKRFSVYAEASAGPMYFTQHTKEQSTQFNFIDQGGGGFYFFLKKDTALNVGYRRRHISNCSIKSPNSGINSDSYMIGISYFK